MDFSECMSKAEDPKTCRVGAEGRRRAGVPAAKRAAALPWFTTARSPAMPPCCECACPATTSHRPPAWLQDFRDDYLECLHHRKEVRMDAASGCCGLRATQL